MTIRCFITHTKT